MEVNAMNPETRRIIRPATMICTSLIALLFIAWSGLNSCADEPRAVSFKSTDGVALKGYLFGKGTIGVILAHMYPADQQSWFPLARKLADKGCLALTFDFRGYGESSGEKVIGQIDRDVEGAYQFLKPQVKEVFLMGASMGGTSSILVASRNPVAGVVSLSGPVGFEGLDAREAIKKVTAPLLLIAAQGDAPAEAAARWFDEHAASSKKLMIVPGPEHGTNLFASASGPTVEEAIFKFLEEYK
jgi:pimeloyl-ACP methyl ester carboxylesterase